MNRTLRTHMRLTLVLASAALVVSSVVACGTQPGTSLPRDADALPDAPDVPHLDDGASAVDAPGPGGDDADEVEDADADAQPPDRDVDDEELPLPPPVPPPVLDPVPLASCGPRLVREISGGWPTLEPGDVRFSPNSQLLLISQDGMWGDRVLRLGGAAWLTPEPMSSQPLAIYFDDAWSVGLRATRSRDTVQMVTAPPQWTVSNLPHDGTRAPLVAMAVSPSGRFVATTAFQERGYLVEVWRVPERVPFMTERIVTESDHAVPSIHGGSLVFSPDDRFLLAAVPQSGDLIRLNLDTGARDEIAAHTVRDPDTADDDDPPLIWDGPAVFDALISGDGAYAVTSGTDGVVRRWSMTDLRPVGSPLAATYQVLNLSRFAPHVGTVPMALASDHRTFAYVPRLGFVVLHDTVRDEELARLEFDDAVFVDEIFHGLEDDAVGGLAINAEGTMLAMVSMLGARVWACPEVDLDAAVPLRPLPVSIQVEPTSIEETRWVAVVATDLGDEHIFVTRFTYEGGHSWEAGGLFRRNSPFNVAEGASEVVIRAEVSTEFGYGSATMVFDPNAP